MTLFVFLKPLRLDLQHEADTLHFSSSTQKGLRKTAVYGNDVTSCFGALVSSQPHNRGGAVLRQDGPLRQRSLRIEVGELSAQLLGRLRLREIDLVFLKRLNHPISRKHCGTGDHGRGSNSVHAYVGTELDRQLSDKVIESGLASVVGLAALLWNQGVGGTRQHHGRS